MPTGMVTYTTNAASPVTGTDENIFYSTNFSPSLLVAGTNILAVEVHQANATSSDLSFDLELSAAPAPPRLDVARFGQDVILSWPVFASGFRLQSATDPGPPVSWATLSTVPWQTSLTATASGDIKVYRLWTP